MGKIGDDLQIPGKVWDFEEVCLEKKEQKP
jgi:hypothetical protein